MTEENTAPVLKTVKLSDLIKTDEMTIVRVVENGDGTFDVELESATDSHVLGVKVWVGQTRLEEVGIA